MEAAVVGRGRERPRHRLSLSLCMVVVEVHVFLVECFVMCVIDGMFHVCFG
jgi:hypothetical protein